jgi:putative nucleotidyltransferase with HDIG domain
MAGAATGYAIALFSKRGEMLQQKEQRLASVLECGSELAASCDLYATILHTLKSAVRETSATCGYVMLLEDQDKQLLVTEAAYGVDGEFEFPERMEVGSGMSGYVAKVGQPITVSEAGEELGDFDGVTAGVRSAASIPLVIRSYTGGGQAAVDQVLGVMTLLDLNRTEAFTDENMELLRMLSSLISVAVSNARMEERRRTTFLLTLESLATALEARDEYTRGHSQRVCEVSMMIGEKLGLGAEAMEELRVGTILHDIGKIGVPDAILNKRAKLTDEEFVVMKSHPVIGYEICKPLMLSEGVLMIIRNHHEKLDGSGYPDGLKGGELPLSLRIVCVADAFDAMSSRRPYRSVMDTSTVLAELSRGAGTQFDPVVVENLKELMATDRLLDIYRLHWGETELKVA